MSLKISKNVGLTDIVSSGQKAYIDGSSNQFDDPGAGRSPNPAYNPLLTQHPITGSTVEEKRWLFNDLSTERFENVNIDPTDAVSTDESTWIQLAPDNAGVAGTYSAAGVALAMANISDSNVGKPFWVRVTSPLVGSVQNKSDIKLTVNYRKFAV